MENNVAGTKNKVAQRSQAYEKIEISPIGNRVIQKVLEYLDNQNRFQNRLRKAQM